MSAPKTNIEEQEKRHRPALLGMTAVIIYAVLLLAAFLIYLAWNGQDPEATGPMIDGRTGEPVQTTE